MKQTPKAYNKAAAMQLYTVINQNQSIPFQWFFYPRSVEAMRLFCIIFLFLSPFVFISEAILLLLYILSKFAFVSFHNSTPKFNAFSLSKKKFNAFFLPFAEIAGPVWDDMTFPGYGLWIHMAYLQVAEITPIFLKN